MEAISFEQPATCHVALTFNFPLIIYGRAAGARASAAREAAPTEPEFRLVIFKISAKRKRGCFLYNSKSATHFPLCVAINFAILNRERIRSTERLVNSGELQMRDQNLKGRMEWGSGRLGRPLHVVRSHKSTAKTLTINCMGRKRAKSRETERETSTTTIARPLASSSWAR